MKQRATNRAARHIKQTGLHEQITRALSKLRGYDFLPTNPFKEIVTAFRLQEQAHWVQRLRTEKWMNADDAEISNERLMRRVRKIQDVIGLPAVETLRDDKCKLEILEIPDVLQHEVNGKLLPTKEHTLDMAVCVCLSGLPVEDSLNLFVRRILAESFAVDTNDACSVIGLTVDGKKLADPKRFTAAELRTQRSLISTTIKGAVIEKLSVTLEFLIMLEEPLRSVASSWLGGTSAEPVCTTRLLCVRRSYEFASIDGTDVTTARVYCFFPCLLRPLVCGTFLQESDRQLFNAVVFAHIRTLESSQKDRSAIEDLQLELLRVFKRQLDCLASKQDIVALAEVAMLAEIAARVDVDASVGNFESLLLLSSQSHDLEEFFSLQQALPGIVNGLRQFVANLRTLCTVLTASGRSGFDPRSTTHATKLIYFCSHVRDALRMLRTSVLDLVCGAVSSDFQSLSTHADQLLQELQTAAAALNNAVPTAVRAVVPAYAMQTITSSLRRTAFVLEKIERMLHAGELSAGLDVLQFYWEQRSDEDNVIPPKPRSYLLFKWKHKNKMQHRGLHGKPSVLLLQGFIREVCDDAIDERVKLLDLHRQLIAEGTIASSLFRDVSEYDRTLVRSDVAAAQLVNPTSMLSKSWLRYSTLIAISGLSRNLMQLYGGVPNFVNAEEETLRRDVPEVVSREGSFLRYLSERLVQHALSHAVRQCLLNPTSVPVYFTLTATFRRFATQADLWAQDDDLMMPAYSHLSTPVSQNGDEHDVMGVTVYAACRDVELPLGNLPPTCAGVYGTEELLAGCDNREIFRWFWALPAFLSTKPPELAGMKVTIAFGFHANTALRFGYWTSPLEKLAQADGTSLSDMALFWPKKARSERPADQYCCNRFRSSIPATEQTSTVAFAAASTVYDDGSWGCRLSRRRVNTLGPLRYPGRLKLMAPVTFRHSIADMASKIPAHFATVVNLCLQCLRSQQCVIHAITFPDGSSVSRHFIDSTDTDSLIKLLTGGLEVCVCVIMLVPLRLGLPDVSVIVQAIDQARQTVARGFTIEHDIARDDWHRTTQEGHVRQLLRELLESPTDRVYIKCDICFGAVVIGPPLSQQRSPTTAAALGCSDTTLDQFRHATLYGSEQAARRVFRGLDQLDDREQRRARLIKRIKHDSRILLEQGQFVRAAQLVWPACQLERSDLLPSIIRITESEAAHLLRLLSAIEVALDVLRACTTNFSASFLDDVALMRMLSVCICCEARLIVTSPQVVQLRGGVAMVLSCVNTLENTFEVPQLALNALSLRDAFTKRSSAVDTPELQGLLKLQDIEQQFEEHRGRLSMKLKDSRNLHSLVSALEELKGHLEILGSALTGGLGEICGTALQQFVAK